MGINKPLISILMAVYEPRIDWLREQLLSLNAQTYPNLRLYIRDDCSPTVPHEKIRSCVEECISAFSYEIRRNEKNLGSNGTFECLTQEAEGIYFAYCDQDDVWVPEKLERLEEILTKFDGSMAYSDVSIIDRYGVQIAASLKEIRPRLEYLKGEKLVERYFFRNCTAGCSMLIQSRIAKKILPFPQHTVCDHWLSIGAAAEGKVILLEDPLVKYRQHDGNQTGILTGVTDKISYQIYKITPLKERLIFYKRYWKPSEELKMFVKARCDGKIREIWHYRKFSKYEALLEIVMRIIPERLFQLVLRRSR